MDMRAMKRGQHVILSDALPGTLSNAFVSEITTGHVSVQVEARLDGRDGAYLMYFDYDGNVTLLYDWIDTDTPGYYVEFRWKRPIIPGLKIIACEPIPPPTVGGRVLLCCKIGSCTAKVVNATPDFVAS